MDEETLEGLNIVTKLPCIMLSQSEILDELTPEAVKRQRERNRYNNLSTLAKQHKISKIVEARLKKNSINNTLIEGTVLVPWFIQKVFLYTMATC
jgi:hypothetical protein